MGQTPSVSIQTEVPGASRNLTADEKRQLAAFSLRSMKYVVTGAYQLTVVTAEASTKTVTVPIGFLSNGASGFPDWGYAWIYHDWLYAVHKYDDGTPCMRHEADWIAYELLWYEGRIFSRIAWGIGLSTPLAQAAWDSGGSLTRSFSINGTPMFGKQRA